MILLTAGGKGKHDPRLRKHGTPAHLPGRRRRAVRQRTQALPDLLASRPKRAHAQLGLARAKLRETRPTVEQVAGGITLEEYQTEILPRLVGVPLPEIERVTGLSNSTCSRLRRGLQVPNPKHWAILAGLQTASEDAKGKVRASQT